MLRILGFSCVLVFGLFSCRGSPVADPQINQAIPENEFQPQRALATDSDKIQQLYSLLNESVLYETLSGFALPTNLQIEENQAISANILTTQSSTERLFTSKPNFEVSGEDNIKLEDSKITPQKISPTFVAANKLNELLGQLIPVDKLSIEDSKSQNSESIQSLLTEEKTTKSALEYDYKKQTWPEKVSGNPIIQTIPFKDPATKSPLEYQSQKPSYVGSMSSGYWGLVIPSGNPWLADPPVQNITLQDRLKETTTLTLQGLLSEKPSTKSPLEYQSQRPSYASDPGGISGGHLGPLIPSGNPWPADPPVQNLTLEDRFKETTTLSIQESLSEKHSTKSPLEYQSQRPSYASDLGGISGGHLGSLIPSGNPWPADPPAQNITLQDRLNETTTLTLQGLLSEKPSTKSPLEYQSQRPSYASDPGGISGGHLGPLIPSGNPWPAEPPVQNITLQDRFKDTTTLTLQGLLSENSSTKSPLEYQSQRPSYIGVISGGHLGPLIPSGNPWPAEPPVQNITLQDRLKETTTLTVQGLLTEKPSTKSPLEYQSQRPSYASDPGGISGGHLGPIIPSGNPWPADPPVQNLTLEDRFKETTTLTIQGSLSKKPSTKSPLEYQSQRPSYASDPGGISGGHLGPLIPSGNPWPAEPPVQNITLQDRLKETTTLTVQGFLSENSSTKSPLEYQSQRPSYIGVISGGHLGPLIPSGNPWPADPPVQNLTIEDRFKEPNTTDQGLQSPKLSTKSPLQYQPQRPTFAGIAGGISGGYLGQLIPSGKPWPADPPVQNLTIEDRFKETNTSTALGLQSQKPTTKPPLQYQPQRPTFAGIPGGISGGHFGQLIPPGKPWPADAPTQRPVIVDRFKETTLQSSQSQQTTTKVSVEYIPQKPSFAGTLSSGYLGQLIPPGKPWPAGKEAPN